MYAWQGRAPTLSTLWRTTLSMTGPLRTCSWFLYMDGATSWSGRFCVSEVSDLWVAEQGQPRWGASFSEAWVAAASPWFCFRRHMSGQQKRPRRELRAVCEDLPGALRTCSSGANIVAVASLLRRANDPVRLARKQSAGNREDLHRVASGGQSGERGNHRFLGVHERDSGCSR